MMKRFVLTVLILFLGATAYASNPQVSAKHEATAAVIHTYGDGTRTYQDLGTWETLATANVQSVTTTDQVSAGATSRIYVTSTAKFDDCVLGRSTVEVDGRVFTISAVATNDYIDVNEIIDSDIASSTAVKCGFILECYGDSASYDDNVVFAGATNTSADYPIIVRAADGETVVFDYTSALASTKGVFQVDEDYVYIENLTIQTDQNSSVNCAAVASSGNRYQVANCIITGSNAGSGSFVGLYCLSSSTGYAFNNIIYESDYGIVLSGTSATKMYAYSNTIVDGTTGIYQDSGSVGTAKNCIIQGNSTNITGTWSQTTNVTASVVFEDATNDDYRLDSTDTAAFEQGTAIVTFTDDLYGNERHDVWCVGAHERQRASTSTWYVGETGTEYGNSDGTTAADAWSGFAELETNIASIGDGDTIYVFGSHSPTEIADWDFEEYVTLRFDLSGNPGYIDGMKTVNSANWTNVSGSLYKVAISDYVDFDYNQVTTPASPTTGETWFIPGKYDAYAYAHGRAFKYSGSAWEEYQGWMSRIARVEVDGSEVDPARFGPYEADHINSYTTITDTSALTQADDYWVGSTCVTACNVWVNESSVITSSSQSAGTVTHPTMTYGQDEDWNYYIEDVPSDLIDEDYEWTFRVESGTGYLYMQIPVSPTTITVEYSAGGSGLFLEDCFGLHIRGGSIRKSNDSAITMIGCDRIRISHMNIKQCSPQTFLTANGMIRAFPSHVAIWDGITYSGSVQNNIEIDHNNISDIGSSGGSAIFAHFIEYLDIHHNNITDMRTEPYPKGQNGGIRISSSDHPRVYNNNITFTAYSAIHLNRADDQYLAYNYVRRGMYDYADGAVIYTYNTDEGNGAWEWNRVEEPYNAAAVYGMYIDNETTGINIRNNYFYKINAVNEAIHCNAVAYAWSNGAYNNYIYDDDCTMVDSDWNTHNSQYGNTRLTESDYPFLGSTAILFGF